jgi:hypothetical protein
MRAAAAAGCRQEAGAAGCQQEVEAAAAGHLVAEEAGWLLVQRYFAGWRAA